MDERTFQNREKRARLMDEQLAKIFPEKEGTALTHKTPWQLLVAVILSAQCTDERVNKVTPILFRKYPKLSDYLNLSQKSLEAEVKSTGFFRNKAKNILGAAKTIDRDFKGKVPKTMTELLTVPGVARKTANVVLGNAFGIVEGIAVDTHVRRLAIRFCLTDSKNPTIIERDLMDLLPKSRWFDFGNNLIYYGREICPARKHECDKHPLTLIYPQATSIWPSAK